jgi:HlyD family secretion protein
MSIRRSLFILTLLTLLLPVFVFVGRANQAATQNSGQNLQLYSVQPGRVEIAVTAIGSIKANEVVRLSFMAPGRIDELMAEQGDHVLAGDVIARQVSDVQQLAYDQAALALDMAELQLQKLLEPVAESDIRVAEAQVDSAWGAYLSIQNAVSDDEFRAAELRYEQAQQALDSANQARTEADAGQSDEAYQLLDAQVGQASFNAEIARLQLESLRTGNSGPLSAAYARILQAQRQLDQVKAGPMQVEIDRAGMAVRQAQTQLDQAQSALSRTLITAPFDGVVSALNAEVGSLVAPGVPIIELTNISPLRLTVQADEVDIRQIREGMPARVTLDALQNMQIPARIEQIALVGRNEGGIVSYDVQLVFDEQNPRVRVGMTAESSIVIDERQDVLVIPNLYIRLERGQNRAFVNVLREDDALEEVEIELGLQGQDNSEVVSGLSEGDVIAIDLSGERFSLLGD